MAKQSGIFKLEGTLDDVTFFKSGDGYIVRKKGGVSKSRIKNDPAFRRTRENGSEFGIVANAGKLVRDGGAVMIRKAYDGKLSNRLVTELTKVKNCDMTSARGSRQVYEGIATAEGLQVLRGFDFNVRSGLGNTLYAPYALLTTTGKVTINNLIPADMLNAPPHATHVSFRSGVLVVDFQTDTTTLSMSPIVNLPIDMTESSPVMTPSAVPAGSGTKMFLLLIEFYQEVNGEQYVLNNGNFNVLNLLDLV